MEEPYRRVEVSGPPRALGRELGEAAREEVRGFAAVALERVNHSARVSRRAAVETARRSGAYAEDYAPHMLEELRGVSEASGVSLDDLLLLQVRNQLRDEGACTAAAVSAQASAAGRPLVAQNWDNDPALDPYTIVLVRRPAGRPAFMDVTQAGLIAYIGVSAAGIGLCMNTLPAPARTVGVPHYFTVRGIYESRTLQEAVEAVERAPRAIPANILLVTPQGPADLEVGVDRVHVLWPGPEGWLVHTNHALHPDLCRCAGGFPELIQSQARRQRMEALLRAAGTPLGVAHLQAALQDHQGYPRSICRHPNDSPGTGFWRSVFSVVADPQAGELYVSRGNPCQHPYHTYVLN
ncbi:MAG: C45 family peptidase [Candidatus Latescibacterota bacterium]